MKRKISTKKSTKIHFHIITLFSNVFDSYLHESIIGRAIQEGNIGVSFYNPRDFVKDKHRRIDGRPYGGGPGMVIEVLPVVKAVEKAVGRKKNVKIIFFSVAGKQFSATYAKNFSKKYQHIVLIAGHYEGIDMRVKKILKAEEISIGSYILTGGELPAMVVVDAVSRHIPGVLGNESSIEESRVSSSDVYTRPEVIEHKKKKYRVPKVLLSGHHKKIEEWKHKKNS